MSLNEAAIWFLMGFQRAIRPWLAPLIGIAAALITGPVIVWLVFKGAEALVKWGMR